MSTSALRAQQPSFQPGLSEDNVKRAAETLSHLRYNGPLALSCDDTDLEKALATWQDADDAWLLLGAARGTIRVTSMEEVESALQGEIEMAEKVYATHCAYTTSH